MLCFCNVEPFWRSQIVVTYKNWHLLFYLVRTSSLQPKNYIFVVCYVYSGVTMVSVRKCFSISKYFLKKSWKHLPFYVGLILSKFAARIGYKFLNHIWDMGGLLLPFNYIPKLTHPRSYPFILWPVDIWCNIEIIEVLIFQKTVGKFIKFYNFCEIIRILKENWKHFG